jgi:hypothetical protein
VYWINLTVLRNIAQYLFLIRQKIKNIVATEACVDDNKEEAGALLSNKKSR